MKRWIPCELHTHTFHSDGSQSLMELAEKAANLGLQCIALTDHNTITGNIEREHVMLETGIHIIRGMEWTTFHGHMPILGIHQYEDWRELEPHNLSGAVEKLHRQGAICGIAHPFRVGSPLCTGCYWEYKVEDWNMIDYLEVWSGIMTADQSSNQRAVNLWTSLLNGGYRPTAVYGRDWHSGGTEIMPTAVTYLGIDAASSDLDVAVPDAIKNGSAVITLGPLPLMECKRTDVESVYSIGETVPMTNENNEFEFFLTIDFSTHKNSWPLEEGQMILTLTGSSGNLFQATVSPEQPAINIILSNINTTWIRAELQGKINDQEMIIALTNPIYFKKTEELI
jgi:hypothetical protein